MSHPHNSHPAAVAREAAREGWKEEIRRLAVRENDAAKRHRPVKVWRPDPAYYQSPLMAA